MERLSDEQAMTALLVGDRDALAELVARYQGPLTGYLDRLIGGDWALAQDLVQETFMRVLRQHADRGDRPFKPWLYAIATNLARDHFKSAAVRRATRWDDHFDERLVDDAAGPEDQALAVERGADIVCALATLGAEYRATLALRFYNEMSLQEIAETLDVPVGTVKSRLSIGLRRLRAAVIAAARIEQGAEER